MDVSILLFATLKDAAGSKRVLLQVAGERATVAEVRAALAARYPAMRKSLDSAIAAVNEEFAEADDPVVPGDAVAFFPPVSGGSGEWPLIVRVADAPYSTDDLIGSITTPTTGAVCAFSGFVRGETQAGGAVERTERLEYEAYEAMALAKMRQVADEIRARWPLVQGMALVQRVGLLEVGQPTVFIACASAHRDQGCFEAARYGIDRLKQIVPVWKKEVRPDGSSWVEGTYSPAGADRAQ
ncbi:MAG TPA: molybdopterin converting factor subunit 1 [Candidatus Limnocylindrales bacterium]|nr:molybdopterin converting factor subunit 1 [Candidatus Limnocylindrales bacterium]